MTTIEPQVVLTGRYNVTETANVLKIHRNTLRAHTDSQFIKCNYNRYNKRKFYTGAEIIRYWKAML